MDPAVHLAADLSGKNLGDFHLLRRLGQGGMGQVYLAEQLSLKRNVAIKIMRTDVPVSPASFQRFRAEAEAVARITHANIVQVYSFGEENGLHYMALEYVEGRNLREYLDKKGPLDLPHALSVMRQVAAALQRAGELGIVHRDIKPENILLTRRGEVKVADFGLSRCFDREPGQPHLTQSGVAMGTPLYMSPEQIQGEKLDPRTDIYSFGVTCYHMLTGQAPFRGGNIFELAMQHVQKEPEPLAQLRPDLPVELCLVVQRMMAKAPDQRYQTCGELLKDLSHLRTSLAGQKTLPSGAFANLLPSQRSVSLETATAPAPLQPTGTRRRTRAWAIAGTVVLALLGGGGLAWLRDRPKAVLPPPASNDHPEPVLTELQKQERFLRDAVTQYANPAGDRSRLELGLRHCLELGQFYLKHHRLEDAEEFFTGLMKNPAKVEAYRTLGRLGHAIVLAKQDRPVESNRAFLEVLREKSPQGKRPGGLPFLLNQPEFRSYIGLALDQNQVNDPSQALAPELKLLRDPPHALKKE
jgi:predicted Ser/Thr protein kinase